ncbi:conserved hypothetical protein [Burkholderia mallei PRL-20]|nr:hypothetical protein BMASAVP1_0403 [Burkholderia mallei SAVP1]ABO01906.1 hypothetical protein BMA10247_A1360 [Burkholderia mallei NCTC 10247]EDK55133.1 hypothetical protein BMAFMH_E0112 [Burkholderia mallei FMH]EDK61122.1 hypothetical protein BMAJHU_I0110 [Burkholderia mallei JHU]EDK83852.1 hypothetical protein BMA721280_L0430 [Burkholderia mallei 2002721280]EDP84971.1 hypothetical protein BMA10399_0797 [Burkholderia mallei ATCC 10399]EEP86830.1 conserved hypothetical protein [Burkholderia
MPRTAARSTRSARDAGRAERGGSRTTRQQDHATAGPHDSRIARQQDRTTPSHALTQHRKGAHT